jgi:hypothetical protein
MAAPQCWLCLNGGLAIRQPGRAMNDKTIPLDMGGPPKKGSGNRKDRLAEQLRANLQKRKAQSRSRRTGEADQRPDGLQATKALHKD